MMGAALGFLTIKSLLQSAAQVVKGGVAEGVAELVVYEFS
jgi:hypothetical protein